MESKAVFFFRGSLEILVIYLRGTPWKSSKGSAVRRKKLLMISSHRCRLRCVLPAAQAEYRQVTFTYCTISNVEGFRFQGSEGYIEGLKVERLKGATMGHLQFCGSRAGQPWKSGDEFTSPGHEVGGCLSL